MTSKPDFRKIFDGRKPTPTGVRRRPQAATVENAISAKTPKEIADQAVEIRVLFAEILDLPDRVDHGRVMLAAKAATDFGQ